MRPSGLHRHVAKPGLSAARSRTTGNGNLRRIWCSRRERPPVQACVECAQQRAGKVPPTQLNPGQSKRFGRLLYTHSSLPCAKSPCSPLDGPGLALRIPVSQHSRSTFAALTQHSRSTFAAHLQHPCPADVSHQNAPTTRVSCSPQSHALNPPGALPPRLSRLHHPSRSHDSDSDPRSAHSPNPLPATVLSSDRPST